MDNYNDKGLIEYVAIQLRNKEGDISPKHEQKSNALIFADQKSKINFKKPKFKVEKTKEGIKH